MDRGNEAWNQMTDSNRPVAWRVIDEQDPRAIVATFDNLRDAQSLCEELEPDASPRRGYRFVVDPVRASTLPNGDR
jgi:hypothetical protein